MFTSYIQSSQVRCPKKRVEEVLALAERSTVQRYGSGLAPARAYISLAEEDMKARTLLLLWRAWHLRNGKGQATIAGSVEFLRSYAVSLGLAARPGWTGESNLERKGKDQ
jgi:hypothetical protein